MIVGHKNVLEFLGLSIERNALSHAYLFHGPPGLGKRKVAEWFICRILGIDGDSLPKPLFDVYEVSPLEDAKEKKKKNYITVEQIRVLRGQLQMSSLIGSFKFALVDEAEALNIEAANALLKTLEEPTPKTIIILIASDLSLLPATIVSRSQCIRFLPVPQKEIYEGLIKLGAENQKAQCIAALSCGRPGLAFKFFTQEEYFDNWQKNTAEFLALWGKSLPEKFQFSEKLLKSFDPEILNIWLSALEDMIFIKCGHLSGVKNTFIETKLCQAAEKEDGKIIAELAEDIYKFKNFLRQNINPKLLMENLFLKIKKNSI